MLQMVCLAEIGGKTQRGIEHHILRCVHVIRGDCWIEEQVFCLDIENNKG